MSCDLIILFSLFLSIQFDNITAEVTQNTEALQAGKTELNELRRQKQSLEIDLQALHNMVQYTYYTNYPLGKSFNFLHSQHSHLADMCIVYMIMKYDCIKRSMLVSVHACHLNLHIIFVHPSVFLNHGKTGALFIWWFVKIFLSR